MSFVTGSSRVRRRLGVLVLAVAVVTAGCGGESRADDADAKAASNEGGSATSTPAAGSGEGGKDVSSGGAKGTKGAASPTTTAKPGSGATPTSAPSSKSSSKTTLMDPSSRTLEISVEVMEPCIVPGTTQALIIRTVPDAGVAYDVEYADGLTGLMEGHYGGGYGGMTDDEGTFGHTFVVAPNAPPGKTTIKVLGSKVQEGFGETRGYFTVADATGTCT